MAAKNRSKIPPLVQHLHRAPERFDFFQAVRLMETAAESDRPELDAIRLHPHPSLGFPKSDLEAFSITKIADKQRFELTVNFFGLYGNSTPLPLQISERILHADEESPPLQRFLDVFNHRLLWLYYSAWRKYRHEIGFGNDGRDPIGKRFLALCGVGSEEIRSALPVEPDQLLPRLGLLTQCARSPATLAELIAGLLPDLPPVQVKEFQYRVVPIERSQRARLGRCRVRLGGDMVIGSHIPDISGAVKLVLGPMSYEEYLAYRPGRPKRTQLMNLVRYLLLDPLDIKITSILRAEEAHVMQLGNQRRAKLGMSTWIGHPKERLQAVTE